MKLVTINSAVLKEYTADKEMLQKAKRPCVLIMRLKYKGRNYDFAVPLRSNINPSTPKWQYYQLPTRKTTREHYHHGIHYIKMFPVDKTKVIRFRTEGNKFATMVKSVIDKNEV